MHLQGSTRGRGANPSKGKPSTSPSTKKLNYISQSGRADFDLLTLIRQYRPYFGLFQSKLYNSRDNLSPRRHKLLYNPKSLLGILFTHKINKELPKIERLTLYNSGSKCNTILLTLDGISSPSEFPSSISKHLKRYKFFLNSEKLEIIKVDIRNPLQNNNEPNTYFTKYSELTLSKEELQRFTKRYELQKLKEDRVT